MNVKMLPCITDECPLWDHLPNNHIVSIWWAWSLWKPVQTCRGFSSITNKLLIQYHLSSTTKLTNRALSPSQYSFSWEIYMNMQRLPCVSDEWHLQDLLKNTIISTWWALSLRRPEQTCRGFPSVTNKHPFQAHLLSTILPTHWTLSSS